MIGSTRHMLRRLAPWVFLLAGLSGVVAATAAAADPTELPPLTPPAAAPAAPKPTLPAAAPAAPKPTLPAAAPATPKPTLPAAAPAGTLPVRSPAAAGGPAVEDIGAPIPFAYTGRGQRDPFSLPPQRKGGTDNPNALLETIPLSEFRLVGVVWSAHGAYARVTTQDGRGYTIRRGTAIGQNGGVVRKITRDTVIVEEWDTTVHGTKVRIETPLALRPDEVTQ